MNALKQAAKMVKSAKQDFGFTITAELASGTEVREARDYYESLHIARELKVVAALELLGVDRKHAEAINPLTKMNAAKWLAAAVAASA